ncbi:MAG TPA: hypothetical protein VGK32_15160 [Vicinamibacterales bacterium]|jgi:hypothetical protein
MAHHHAFTRTWLAMLVAGTAALAATSCAKDEATPDPSGNSARAARLQRLNGLLERQIQLADGKEFYLVLDPAAADLTLMLNGAELQRYRVVGLQVGQPRVTWITRRDPRPWQDVIWSHGELDPPRQLDRLVIQAAPPTKDAAEPEAPPVPPTPEELYPIPTRYQVRFDDGRSIEVRPLDVDRDAGRMARLRAWWSAKWHDVVAALSSRDHDSVRLRIALGPKDAASLYRSLPPGVRMIVLSRDSLPAPRSTPRPSSAPVRAPAAPGNP